jgi:hypothetical protein
MMKRYVHLAGLGLLASSNSAWAWVTHSTENEWQSATINALGGVGQMSENHADQFFSDPSLPADDPRSFSLQWLSLNATYSEGLKNAFTSFRNLSKAGNSSQNGVSSTITVLDGVRGLFGEQLGGGTSASVFSLKIKGFSIVPYVNASIDAGVHVPSLPQAQADGDAFAGVGLGYAFGFGKSSGSKSKGGGQMFTFGANIRPGVRAVGSVDIDSSAAGDFSSQSSASGTDATRKYLKYGLGLYTPIDTGVAYRPTATVRLNFVARDILATKSWKTLYGTKPPDYKTRLSLGGHWDALQNKEHTITLGSELQDLLNLGQPSGIWYRWQLAGAYKYKLPFRSQTSFGLNCGLQSGYPAYGVFLDLFVAKIEASRSTRELGYYIGQHPDTRTSYRISSSLTF